MRLLADFSVMAGFPIFESVDKVDFTENVVFGVNLYVMANRLNEYLLSLGGGVSVEEREELLHYENEVSMAVRRTDMTMLGQRFFGEGFYFPRGVYAQFIMPLDSDSDFYVPTGWSGGLGHNRYLLINVYEQNGDIVATFLEHYVYTGPLSVWPLDRELPVNSILFWVDEFMNRPFLSIDFEEFEQTVYFGPETSPTDYLAYITTLPVPQGELHTITVTFRREAATGNLIAVSSRYNRNSPD